MSVNVYLPLARFSSCPLTCHPDGACSLRAGRPMHSPAASTLSARCTTVALWFPTARPVRIRRPRWNRPSPMAPAHRSHVARSKTSHSPARGHTQLRRTVAAGQRSRRPRSLRLNRQKLSRSVSSNADTHSRHVVRHEECLLLVYCELRAIARSFELHFSRMHVKASAVRGGDASVVAQLFPYGIHSRARSGAGCRRSLRLIACRQTANSDQQKNQGSFHNRVILNPRRLRIVLQSEPGT